MRLRAVGQHGVDEQQPGARIDDATGVAQDARTGEGLRHYGERATIAENLEAAYVALDQAIRGIWVEKALVWGEVREYWDDSDVDEMEALTLEASVAVERAWRTLSAVGEAHTAQEQAEGATDEDD